MIVGCPLFAGTLQPSIRRIEPGRVVAISKMSSDNENDLHEVRGEDESFPFPGALHQACRMLSAQLAEAGQKLRVICSDSDPLFIQTGRDLREVAGETATLTETIRQAAMLVSRGDEGQQGPLARSGQVVQDVLARLSHDRQEIEEDLRQIRDLIIQISDCRRINEAIDRISASFRAVRINIRIQCSAQLISEDMFKDVTEDIDKLAKSLALITKEIKNDLSASVKKLVALEREVTASLLAAERVSVSARGVVTRALGDISQLFAGTERMVREAGRRSEVIAGKVGEVVVSIQFHDSLSQRANHILQAFADIARLCDPEAGEVGPETLGSACLILDLQHRQLTHIVDEISAIHTQIGQAFARIGSEVNGLNSILVDNQFKAVGPQQFLSSLYASLQKALRQLCELVAEGTAMINRINAAAAETKNVAARLTEIMENVREMRDETRLQAVNTIIMASNLGQRGRTIQVLAKEISALSEQTTELVADVEVLQLAVNHKVEKLCRTWERSGNGANDTSLEADITLIDASYREVEKVFAALTRQIDVSESHIEAVQDGLHFIHDLQEGLQAVVLFVEQARDSLLPWRDSASSDSAEMKQLIERYTMEQERLIHMFDRVGEGQERRGDEDIFF